MTALGIPGNGHATDAPRPPTILPFLASAGAPADASRDEAGSNANDPGHAGVLAWPPAASVVIVMALGDGALGRRYLPRA